MLDRGGEFPLAGGDPDGDPQRGGAGSPPRQIPQRLPDAGALEPDSSSTAERTRPRPARASSLLATKPLVGGGVRIEVAVAPFQVHPDPDQALGDAIVQVARDSVPLRTHQLRLAGPGEVVPRPAELLVAAGQLLGAPLGLGPAALSPGGAVPPHG